MITKLIRLNFLLLPPFLVECTQDWDCPVTQTCFQQRCQLPCDIRNPCAQNAICVNTNHAAECSCSNGYEGNPYIGCQPGKFYSKSYTYFLFFFQFNLSSLDLMTP